jgi:antitoxin (DNA-binding transcriptional repressor) of toxin-antitoxin stability system
VSAGEARVRYARLMSRVVHGETVCPCRYGCAVAKITTLGGTACGDGGLAVAHLGQGGVTR